MCESKESKQVVFKTLVESVEDGIKNKKSNAEIFMLDKEHLLVLNKLRWRNSLLKAVEFFSSEDIENYEMCKRCKDLMDILDSELLENLSYEK
jgi:hypothetical protein